MKLSTQTVNILKNFASINQSIVLKEGNVLSTISTSKTVMARAKVQEEFPKTCGLININQLLGGMSLLEEPELHFGDSAVTIRGTNKAIDGDVRYADISLIQVPPEKEIKLPSVDVEFVLTNSDLQKAQKALGVFSLTDIVIVGDGTNIRIEAVDVKNATSNAFRVVLGESNQVFRAVFRNDNLKMIEGDYTVRMSSKGISQFVGTDVTYWIAIEAQHSTF